MAKNQRSIKWIEYEGYYNLEPYDVSERVNRRLEDLQADPAVRVDYTHFKPVIVPIEGEYPQTFTYVTISGRRLETVSADNEEE